MVEPVTIDTLLTRNEVARLLGVSLPSLWRLDKRGELCPLRIGSRCVRYLPDEVDAFLSKQKNARGRKTGGSSHRERTHTRQGQARLSRRGGRSWT